MKLIDSHCHLHYDYAPKSIADILNEARADGVGAFVTVGTDLGSFAPLAQIAEQHPDVWFTVGVHPHEAETLKDEDLGTIRAAAAHPKCKAIGEIGLDYHYDHSPRDVQRAWLDRQLDLAAELGLPVVIHSRDGEADLLASLTRYAAKVKKGVVPGIIHCFTGTREFGRACLALGFYISFSGILTFKNAQDLRDSAAEFPLDRLLVETDSPYLAPIPFRGKKCEPAMVKHTALKLAEIKGVSFEALAEATARNTVRVFGLPALA